MNNNTKKGLHVISIFDGISVLQQSLKELEIPFEKYIAVELDSSARAVTKKNFPDTIFYNDVREFNGHEFADVPVLLVWGSPCQSFSFLGKQEGLKGKSGLFLEAVRVLHEVKPMFFLMENVQMKNAFKLHISKTLGVDSVLLDSSLLGSPQKRLRNFWSNMEIPQVSTFNAVDSGKTFQDIVENGWARSKHAKTLITNQVSETESGLARALGLSAFGAVGNIIFKEKHVAEMEPKHILEYYRKNAVQGVKDSPTSFGKNGIFRVPSPLECERLMGLPDNYTELCSMTKRYLLTGNAFCTHHIKYILNQNINKLKSLTNE